MGINLNDLWNDLFGGGDQQASVDYQWSPQQEEMFNLIMPLMEKMSAFGMGEGPVPYKIPDISGMMPTKGWYEGLEPGIKEAAWEPYMKGYDILENRMAGRGTLGSARAGVSGAAADVMSQYTQQVTPQVTSSLWGMTQPALQAGWGALAQREKAPYDMMGMGSQALPTGIVTQPQSSMMQQLLPWMLMYGMGQ